MLMALIHGRLGIFRHWLHWSNMPSSSPPQPGQRVPWKSGNFSRHSTQNVLIELFRCLSQSQSGQGNSSKQFKILVCSFIKIQPRKTKAHPEKRTGLSCFSTPSRTYLPGIDVQTPMLLAFGTALDQSSHAGFAACEVCLAATAFDDFVVLLTHDEPTLFVKLLLFNTNVFTLHICII